MIELETWGGNGNFHFDADEENQRFIFIYGESQSKAFLPYAAWAKLCSDFSGKTIPVASSRDTVTPGSLDEWLKTNVTSTVIAPYVAPALVQCGLATRSGDGKCLEFLPPSAYVDSSPQTKKSVFAIFDLQTTIVTVTAIAMIGILGYAYFQISEASGASDSDAGALDTVAEKQVDEFISTGLCERVENAKFTVVERGTISYTDATGDLKKPLPALIAKKEFTCVMATFGTKERDESWVVLAKDDEFGMLRCIRTSNEQLVREAAASCKFQKQ